MEFRVFTVLSVLSVLVGTACSAIMPDYIKICSRNDPKIAECIKSTVHNLRPYLKNGITELNVPPMEPLYLGDLNILEGGQTGLNVRAKKLNIYGASNFEIKKIKALDNNLRFDFELSLPRLRGEGNYDISGQILTLPLRGSGPFTGNFTNFYAFVKVIFEIKNVNGEDYVHLKDLQVKIRTGNGRIILRNLFNGDKALGDVINDTINQNFELFTNEIIQPLERVLEKKFSSITSKILDNFTYDELFTKS